MRSECSNHNMTGSSKLIPSRSERVQLKFHTMEDLVTLTYQTALTTTKMRRAALLARP